MAKSVLGEYIAKYRKEARMTQEELGRTVGVSTQAVSRWECGGTPDVELLPMIADCLHVSIDALYGRAGGEALDVKELVYQKIKNAPQEKCMDLLLDHVWYMQQAAQINYMPEFAPAFEMMPLGAMNRSGEENPGLVPDSLMLCDDRSCMLHGMVQDKRFAAILSQPEGGFEAGLKRSEEYVKLFRLLSKPHYLDMLININMRKPKEYFTVRSAAARIGVTEAEAKEILEELYHYMMLERMEVSDEQGMVEIYNLSADVNLVVFLFFCETLMRSEGSMHMNADIRQTPMFGAVPGTGSLVPDWKLRGEDEDAESTM